MSLPNHDQDMGKEEFELYWDDSMSKDEFTVIVRKQSQRLQIYQSTQSQEFKFDDTSNACIVDNETPIRPEFETIHKNNTLPQIARGSADIAPTSCKEDTVDDKISQGRPVIHKTTHARTYTNTTYNTGESFSNSKRKRISTTTSSCTAATATATTTTKTKTRIKTKTKTDKPIAMHTFEPEINNRPSKAVHNTNQTYQGTKISKDYQNERMNAKYATNNDPQKCFDHCIDTNEGSWNHYLVEQYSGTRISFIDYIENKRRLKKIGEITSQEWINMMQYLIGKIANSLYFLHETCNWAHLNISMSNFAIGNSYSQMNESKSSKTLVDITPDLLDSDKSIFITQGMTSMIETNGKCNNDSIHYQSPEMRETGQRKYFDVFKADVWALGIIIFYLLVGCYPFKNGSDLHSYKSWLVLHGHLIEILRASNPKCYKLVPNEALDLLNHMLTYEHCRFTMREVINHPFIRHAPKKFDPKLIGTSSLQ